MTQSPRIEKRDSHFFSEEIRTSHRAIIANTFVFLPHYCVLDSEDGNELFVKHVDLQNLRFDERS